MRGYQTEFTAYTGGRGRMSCSLKGYDVCHDQEEVVAAIGYDSESDLENRQDRLLRPRSGIHRALVSGGGIHAS